jgi:hypothetical protein
LLDEPRRDLLSELRVLEACPWGLFLLGRWIRRERKGAVMEIHIRLSIDDRIVSMARRLRAVFTKRTIAGSLGVLVLGSAVAVMAAPVDKPHDFKAGDALHASDLNDDFDALYNELNARVIRADTTIQAADCKAIISALADLDDRRIASSATVTIAVAAGSSACPNSVSIDHPDGGHIQIVGQGSSATTLTFFKVDGVRLPMSRSVGLVDKLTLTGGGGTGDGVVVLGSASAVLGGDLVVSGFYNGVRTEGGFIQTDSVTSSGNTMHGFMAHSGGVIVAKNPVARDNGQYGFEAVLDSSIFADGAKAEGNAVFGFDANAGGAIQADNATASHSQHGFNANDNGTIIAQNASASSGDFGFAAWNNGHFDLQKPVSNDNTTGFSARFGSFAHVTTPSGNSQTYSPPGPNMPNTAEDSFVLQD